MDITPVTDLRTFTGLCEKGRIQAPRPPKLKAVKGPEIVQKEITKNITGLFSIFFLSILIFSYFYGVTKSSRVIKYKKAMN